MKPYLKDPTQKNCFELVTIHKSYYLQAESKEGFDCVRIVPFRNCIISQSKKKKQILEMDQWMDKIQNAIATLLNSVTSVKEMANASSAGTTPEEEWRLIQQVAQENLFCADCSAAGIRR